MYLVDRRFLVVWRIVNGCLFDQFKVFLANTTIRTEPVFRNIFPLGSRSNTVIRPAVLFIVNQATDNTFPLAHANTLSRSIRCPRLAR